MLLSVRDIEIMKLLRWCRMIRPKDVYTVFQKREVENLCAAQLLRFSNSANALLLTPHGHRLLEAASQPLPPATAPTYRETDIQRRLRVSQITLTAYAADIHVFNLDAAELQVQPSFFLPSLQRNRGTNPWGSTRVAALLHMGDLLCAVHWVCPQIGCIALNDELTAFYNHTAAVSAKQRTMIFAANSYEEILAELTAERSGQSMHLQTYQEVYDCLKLPLFLLPCNDTGILQLRILALPDYRRELTRAILKSHYVPPPKGRPLYDALYNGVPFLMAADMDLRRIESAISAAQSDGISQIVLAALPEQVETVLNCRYRQTGKARVFTITDAALRSALGNTAPYLPPNTPFYTPEGDVLDVPPLKAP